MTDKDDSTSRATRGERFANLWTAREPVADPGHMDYSLTLPVPDHHGERIESFRRRYARWASRLMGRGHT